MFKIRRLAACVLTLAFGSITHAQTPPGPASLAERLPMADKLPADTTVYAFRAGGDALARKLKGTPAGNIVADEDVAAMLKSLEGMFREADDAKVRNVWQLVVEMFHSDTVCAHLPGEKDGQPEVLLIAIPTNEERRKSLKSAIETFSRTMLTGEDDDDSAEELGEDVPGGVLYGSGGSDVRLGWVRDRLVMFRGEKARAIVFGESPQSPLIHSERFRKAAEGMKLENPVGFYFYNLSPIWREVLLEGANQKAAEGIQKKRLHEQDDESEKDATTKPTGDDSSDDSENDPEPALVTTGLTNLAAMAGGVSVHDGRYHNEHFWVLEGPRRGLFKHISNNPIPQGWLKAIPADAVSFTYGTIDPESLLRATLLERVKHGAGEGGDENGTEHKAESKKEGKKNEPSSEEIDPGEPVVEKQHGPNGGVGLEVQEALTRPAVEQDAKKKEDPGDTKSRPNVPDASGWTLFGVEYGKGLIDELGTRYLIHRRPNEGLAVNPFGMFFPPLMVLPPHQMVFALEIKDRARFAAAFEDYWARARKVLPDKVDGGFFGGGPPRMRRIKYKGEWIHEFQYFIAVYFHLAKDRLLISTSPELLKDAIAAATAGGSSLVDSPEFKAVFAKVPKDACCLIYMHKRSFFELLYKGYAGLAQQFGPMALSALPKNDFSFADLPPAKSISKHMNESAYLYGVATPDGVHWDGQADLLPLSWWVAQIQTIVDGMMLAGGG